MEEQGKRQAGLGAQSLRSNSLYPISLFAIVRSRCEEILALREKERKRKEREARAAKPLTSRPFATALAHLAA